MTRAATLALACLLGCLFGPGGAPASAAQAAAASAAKPAPKATFGIGPANAKGVDGRPDLTFLAAPGSRLIDRIALVNVGTKPVTLSLYTADATVGADGAFGYQPRSAPRKDAGTWITPQTPGGGSTVTVAPRATRVLPLSIAVPANASPGDHAAGVIASLTSKVRSSTGPVDFEQRVAVRTFIRVSGALKPALTVEGLTAQYAGAANPFGRGSVRVHYRVRNTGNLRLGARQKLTISGLLGTRRPAKAIADVPLLLPGSSVEVTATVPGVLPQFRLTARVTLYPVIGAGDVDPDLPRSFTSTTTAWAVPWALLVLLAGLAALIGGGLLLRRRRPRREGRHHRRRPGASAAGDHVPDRTDEHVPTGS